MEFQDLRVIGHGQSHFMKIPQRLLVVNGVEEEQRRDLHVHIR